QDRDSPLEVRPPAENRARDGLRSYDRRTRRLRARIHRTRRRIAGAIPLNEEPVELTLMDRSDWFSLAELSAEQLKWCVLLDQQLDDAMIALVDCGATEAALAAGVGGPTFQVNLARHFYSAKNFVLAMHRFRKILEALVAQRRIFPTEVSDRIRLA